MSDLKNVLKAGLLVTASLFATGCGDKDTGTAPAPAPSPSPSPAPNGDSTTSVKSEVPSFVLNLKDVRESLFKSGLSAYLLDAPTDAAKGYGADFDIIAKLKPAPNVTKLATAAPKVAPVAAFDKNALVERMGLHSPAGESFALKFTDPKLFPAAKPTIIGGLVLDGKVDDTLRSTIRATVTTDGVRPVDTNLVILRSAVLKPGATKDAVISTPYAYVGIDAAIGYDFARESADGKEIVLPVTVHATPTDAAKLSAGTATQSKATQATKVPTLTNAKTADKAVKAPTAAVAGKKLTLKMVKPGSDQKIMLDKAGLNVRASKGALDIGGRIAHVDASDVVISAISADQPELTSVEGVAIAKLAATKVKSTSTTQTAQKASDATKGKTAVPQGKDVAGKFIATVKPTTVNADKTITGLYADIGELKVGAGTEFQALAHHSLLVHNLVLANDLEVSVFTQDHSLTKLTKLTWATAAAKDGQGLMQSLSEEENHPISKFGVTGDAAKTYYHYDSFTPFPLWVAGATVTAGKTLKFTQLTLDTDVKLEAGVYVYPLVKDLSASLPDSTGAANITLAADDSAHKALEIKNWKIIRNGYDDVVLLVNVTAKAPLALSAGTFERALMSSKAQGRHSVATATLDAVVSKLDPTNLVSASFASLSSSRLNQASQIASLARGVDSASAEKLGAVEQYSVTFNHAGAQFGLTYNLDGGNAFSSSKGTTSFGANVASDVMGLKAIVSAEASVDAGKNAYASSSLASYNAGVTFAKAYSLGGLSVVPMGGFGVSSNALNSYSAVVPMAASALGLYMNDVSFTAATFHAGVNLALDDFVAAATGANASLTLGVAGYLASSANATLSTSEGKSSDLQFGGDAVTPYAQFNLGFATGEKLNTMVSSGIVAVNFGLDR